MMTGAILSGGRSKRMGIDKAFIKINGQPIVTTIKETLEKVFSPVILVGGSKEKFSEIGLIVLPDLVRDRNSLGGLYSALSHSTTERTFVTACDMPFLTPEILRFLVGQIDVEDALIPNAHGFHQPFCGIYHRRCLSLLERSLKHDDGSLHGFLESIAVRYLEETLLRSIDPDLRSFVNLNSVADLTDLGLSLQPFTNETRRE